jgi:hypothetical protein
VPVSIVVNTALPRRTSERPWGGKPSCHGLIFSWFRCEPRFMSVSTERAMILWIIDDHEKLKWLFFIPAKN